MAQPGHRISGALEPSAMRVKLATVSFHTWFDDWKILEDAEDI